MPDTITVHEVLCDASGEGPTGDGTVISRFGDIATATRFAKANTYLGNACEVHTREVSRPLAERWGMA